MTARLLFDLFKLRIGIVIALTAGVGMRSLERRLSGL